MDRRLPFLTRFGKESPVTRAEREPRAYFSSFWLPDSTGLFISANLEQDCGRKN
jgi:hypothetical protein